MKILNNLESFMQTASDTFVKSMEIEAGECTKARYYLLQRTCRSENPCLLKFFSFESKHQFKDWRDECLRLRLVEWTAGFLFKFYDDDHHYLLVDKNGKEPKRYN